jgi:hypothetical protein
MRRIIVRGLIAPQAQQQGEILMRFGGQKACFEARDAGEG